MRNNTTPLNGVRGKGDHDSLFLNDDGLTGPVDPGEALWVRPTVSHETVVHQNIQPMSAGTGNGAASPPATLSPVSSATASPFVINITWDASVDAAPSGFKAGVLAAVQYLESQFTDAVTINISVGYGEVNGIPMGGGDLGQSIYFLDNVGYAQLVGGLQTDAKTVTDTSAVASLPASSPVSGSFWTTMAQAKALGLVSGDGSSIDGYIGLSSSFGFDYDTSDGVSGYDFNGVVLHEITEVMGRALLTGGSIGPFSPSYYAADLFHYSSAGVRDFSASTPGYFSIDGGVTNLGDFNTSPSGDPGDWASSVANDSFDGVSSAGVINAVTANDLALMDAIGWDLATTPPPLPPPPPPPPTPSGVSLSPLVASQTNTGLAAKAALAKVTQAGGPAGDSYSYSLGGKDGAFFTLSTSSNVATLSVGSADVSGDVNGKLYALTITTTDVTIGTSSPAVPVSVLVASSSSDTVSVAAQIGGLSSASAAFVYGLGGADTLDGSGMTGALTFVGGADADVMTGGSGVNDYVYGSVGDSSRGVDVITNFHAAEDRIDLTGVGAALTYAGSLPSTVQGETVSDLVLPAHSVGWQTSGGNTFVYANTSGASESLADSDMTIELLGTVPLTSSNIGSSSINCFVAGTRIMTARGEVCVEDLEVGEKVHARLAGVTWIKWIGDRRVDCQRHPEPRLVRPVRIVAGAFGPESPCRDLLLSPDHAVAVGDVLVPIKLLVNGASIRQETGRADVHYYHIELERHDVLMAEGLPAESYLDTGNRGMFANADAPRVLHPLMADSGGQALRESLSCLPLRCDPTHVEPIWHTLAARAVRLGIVPAVAATTDPLLCIVAGSRCFAPVERDGARYSFMLPALPGGLRLQSRCAVASTLRPWLADHRRLGVMVRRISLRYGTECIDSALDDPRLEHGWWGIERDTNGMWRWTDGDAALPPTDGPVIVEVLLGDGLSYPVGDVVDTEATDPTRRAA